MAQKYSNDIPNYDWSQAKSLMPFSEQENAGPQGAIVPDHNPNWDHIAVVYDQGNTPPQITVQAVSGSVHTVFADGQPVAVVARTDGPAPVAEDVLLVERAIAG